LAGGGGDGDSGRSEEGEGADLRRERERAGGGDGRRLERVIGFGIFLYEANMISAIGLMINGQ
jgi:hypothetical protein